MRAASSSRARMRSCCAWAAITPRCGGTSPAVSSTSACRRRSESAERARVEEGAFRDVAPIHDGRAELLVARVDFLGKIVPGAGLGDDVLAHREKGFQQGVVELQDFDGALVPQLAQ